MPELLHDTAARRQAIRNGRGIPFPAAVVTLFFAECRVWFNRCQSRPWHGREACGELVLYRLDCLRHDDAGFFPCESRMWHTPLGQWVEWDHRPCQHHAQATDA
jgi:hypothetical protein